MWLSVDFTLLLFFHSKWTGFESDWDSVSSHDSLDQTEFNSSNHTDPCRFRFGTLFWRTSVRPLPPSTKPLLLIRARSTSTRSFSTHWVVLALAEANTNFEDLQLINASRFDFQNAKLGIDKRENVKLN